MLIVRSPVRVSFGGGGTDMPSFYEQFGGIVLSTSINKYFYTILTKRDDGRIQVISSDLKVNETWTDISSVSLEGSELEIPLAVLKELKPTASFNLFMASEIPPGTGLGSSASVAVGVLKAVSTYLGKFKSREELAETAFRIARCRLTKPVGKQDEYASAFGGLNCFRFDRDGSVTVEKVAMAPSDLAELQHRLLLFFTGTAHNSWSILKSQEEATTASSGAAVSALTRIKEQAEEMRSALEGGDLDRFGRLLNDAWCAKKKITSSISNPRIDHLYCSATAAGALGGKITGAGGGGFLLLYCEPSRQGEVRRVMAAHGVREMHFEFDTQGAQLIVDDPFADGDENCGMRWIYSPVTSLRSIA